KIGGFGKAISPLGKFTGLIGLDSSALISSISDRIIGDTSASKARQTAAEALRKANRPILVVMDDLDRLTLLVVFKLVRLVGNLPNVYYLIGFDEQTLLDVLRRSDLVGSSGHRASEFLEKIIQVRLDLPAFRERDASAMVDRSLAALLDAHQLSLTEAEQRRFVEAYFQCLEQRLRTPRAIKRYFGQAAASLGSLAGEVDLVDFLLVTFVRTSEPGVYRLLGRHRAELTGTSLELAARSNRHPGDRTQVWRERLTSAGVREEHLDGILGLLSMLFPALSRSLGAGGDLAAAAHQRGIGSNDYFDRYVVFGVPDDDLSETELTEALTQLRAGTPGPEAAELLLRLEDDTHRIRRRLGQRLQAGAAVPAAALLLAVAERYGTLRAQAEFMLSADASARFLAQDLFRTLPHDTHAQVLTDMAASPQGASLAGRVLYDAVEPADTGLPYAQENDAWVQPARTAIAEQLEHHLTTAGSQPADDLTKPDIDLIWTWRHVDAATARTWIRERLDNGTWQLLPLLAKLIPPRPAPFTTVDAETLASLDALIDHDEVYALLDQPSPATGTATGHAHVLDGLRQARDRGRTTTNE
ncbi:P-loop NTPase fold protein, partial [Streptomyces althioticus]|uniref:P-loop NTPase fold protein n=1 Tax=Streptomyces althioticus TaxID=83380 RepID=UPI0036F98528